MALCSSENIWSVFIKIKETMFGFKHKALDVYESSLAHCVDEGSTNAGSAHPPSFVRLVQKTGTNQYVYKLLQSHKS